MSDIKISDVSDTAHWVAVYRAQETDRPDALFRDPYARKLAGERGEHIAQHMSATKHVRFAVVMRTKIIDEYIYDLVACGVDTIINLGAGLDARPYRMNLPASLRWIEVDYPHMIQLKNERLAGDQPRCRLERVAVDLGNDQARREFLERIAGETQNAVVLTEGVIPYLSEQEAGALAEDLRRSGHFRYWILDFLSPKVYKHVDTAKRNREMKNAPFKFRPVDWYGFFESRGWKVTAKKFNGEEAVKVGRPLPFPWFIRLILRFKKPDPVQLQYSGYFIIEPR